MEESFSLVTLVVVEDEDLISAAGGADTGAEAEIGAGTATFEVNPGISSSSSFPSSFTMLLISTKGRDSSAESSSDMSRAAAAAADDDLDVAVE